MYIYVTTFVFIGRLPEEDKTLIINRFLIPRAALEGARSRSKRLKDSRLASYSQQPEGVVELREGFSHTFLIVNLYSAVRTKGSHLQGHNHTVVVT